MDHLIYTIVIPIALLFVPWLLVRYVFSTPVSRKLAYWPQAWYLWIAAALWELAMVVPNIPLAAIAAETTSFSMHLTGGVVTAVLYRYALEAYKVTCTAGWQPWLGLYFFASAAGVLNELFEFTADKIGIIPLPSYVTPRDTWWDLVANTGGALCGFAVLQIGAAMHKKWCSDARLTK